MQQRNFAGSPDILFRTPTELADGLALKELARFLQEEVRPNNMVPPFRTGPDSAWLHRSKRPGRPSAPLLPSYARLELRLKHPCLASGRRARPGSARLRRLPR